MFKQAQWQGEETGKEEDEEAWKMLWLGALVQDERRWTGMDGDNGLAGLLTSRFEGPCMFLPSASICILSTVAFWKLLGECPVTPSLFLLAST